MTKYDKYYLIIGSKFLGCQNLINSMRIFKTIEQTKKKGKRLNICGLLEIGKGFEYGLALKSFKSDSYIKLMDWQADKAEKRLRETGQITVIVEDQGPLHVSRATKEQYKRWEKQGLYIFLLVRVVYE